MIKTLTSVAAALLLAGTAHAAVVTVDAQADAIGTAGATTTLTAGETFTITASPLDTWSAGADLRISNANGLTGPIFAQAGDDSGAAQVGKVPRNLRLALPKDLHEVADADFLAVHQVQQPEPGAIGERCKQQCQVVVLRRMAHRTIICGLTDTSRR